VSRTIFMVEVETTGVDIESDFLLEFAFLALQWDEGADLWKPAGHITDVLPYAGEPETDFAKEHHLALYAECNARFANQKSGHFGRGHILQFFRRYSEDQRVKIVGWNCAGFDLPFLVDHKLLERPGYEGEKPTGDYHYRVYEMSGFIRGLADIKNIQSHSIKNSASTLGLGTIEWAPECAKLGPHRALWDCYRQTEYLNGLILLGRP